MGGNSKLKISTVSHSGGTKFIAESSHLSLSSLYDPPSINFSFFNQSLYSEYFAVIKEEQKS